jgi:hypothetical protein
MTTVSVNLTVDLSQVTHQTLTQAIAAFMKVIDGKQEALIHLDPETGRPTNKALTQAEIQDIAEKLNGQEERKAKKAARKSNRAPLNDVEKAAIRVRLLTGKLRKATDKATKEELRAKIAEYQAVLDQPETERIAKKVAARKVDPEAERLATGTAVAKVLKSKKVAPMEDAGEDLPIVKSKKGVIVETHYADGKVKTGKVSKK